MHRLICSFIFAEDEQSSRQQCNKTAILSAFINVSFSLKASSGSKWMDLLTWLLSAFPIFLFNTVMGGRIFLFLSFCKCIVLFMYHINITKPYYTVVVFDTCQNWRFHYKKIGACSHGLDIGGLCLNSHRLLSVDCQYNKK